ncbi:hypothetical protein [Ascidiimonas aurantiaca]|uniref:hypothetical protein n=1 Tax=Ascidiimonas aurantiaca TaxID=1685432 RepID=UPI0030ED5F9C
MKKIMFSIALFVITFGVNSQNQTIGVNYSFGFNPDNDNFTYNGASLGNYALGWYSGTSSAEARLSGYGGIKLFTNKNPRLTISINGNIGIGTINPLSKLHLYSNDSNVSSDAGLTVEQNGSGDAQVQYLLTGVQRWVTGIDNSDGNKFVIGRGTNWVQGRDLIITDSGNIGIGTSNPDMKLTVKGNIHAEEVKIDLNVPAPDYVFKKDYKLRSIEALEKFIEENHHLPEIPSAKEFEQNGILQAKMDMDLLKKIEELTLYIIAQQKEIERLKSMEKRLTEVEKLLELENRTLYNNKHN